MPITWAFGGKKKKREEPLQKWNQQIRHPELDFNRIYWQWKETKRERSEVTDEFLSLSLFLCVSVSLSVTVPLPIGNVSFRINGGHCTAHVAYALYYVGWISFIFSMCTISAHFMAEVLKHLNLLEMQLQCEINTLKWYCNILNS